MTIISFRIWVIWSSIAIIAGLALVTHLAARAKSADVTGVETPDRGGWTPSGGENTALVVPPGVNVACPLGMAFVSVGGPPRLLKMRLDAAGNPSAGAVATDIFPQLRTVPGILPTDDFCDECGRNDNLFIRLRNGNLFLVRQGVRKNEPVRRVEYMWRSEDCGATWKLASVLDPVHVAGGYEYAFGGDGGFDRPEIYADPWENPQVLYFSVSARGKDLSGTTYHPSRGLLFFSTDGGDHWTKSDGNVAPTWFVMTSTPPNGTHTLNGVPIGRLFLFQCSGSDLRTPSLYWSDDHGRTISGPHEVYYEEQGKQIHCDTVGGIATGILGTYSVGISRVGSYPWQEPIPAADVIRVMYPAVLKPTLVRQALVVARVTVLSDDRLDSGRAVLSVSPLKKIEATARSGSVMLATMAETDRVDLPANDRSTNDALLSWQETELTGSIGTFPYGRGSARALLVRDSDWSAPIDLSRDRVGNRRWWRPWMPGGDYDKAAFFFDQSRPHFFAQWLEPDGIHSNIISRTLVSISGSRIASYR